ncbi:MAG: hypothetical protein ACHQT8_01350 [Chlamydiales bacterium]
MSKSPPSSGGLSPLGLDGLSSSRISITRTFKDAIKDLQKPKRVLIRSHSVFTSRDEEAFSTEQYTQFQKTVQQSKTSSAMEKDDQKRPHARILNSPLRDRRTAFTEKTADEYFRKFPIKAKAVGGKGEATILETPPICNVHVNRSAVSNEQPVTAYEMGDALAVFCLGKKEVLVHHFSTGTDTLKGVFDPFAKFPQEKTSTYKIHIVGGDGSRESILLLQNIKDALEIYFGTQATMAETLINPNKTSDFPYISVACTQKHTFFFCRHD